MVEEEGVGREGSLVGGAMGRVSDSRLTCRHIVDFERECPRLRGIPCPSSLEMGAINSELVLSLRLCAERVRAKPPRTATGAAGKFEDGLSMLLLGLGRMK